MAIDKAVVKNKLLKYIQGQFPVKTYVGYDTDLTKVGYLHDDSILQIRGFLLSAFNITLPASWTTMANFRTITEIGELVHMATSTKAFLVTTCNRETTCRELVAQLTGYGDVYVVNDGCEYIIPGAVQSIQKIRNGREGYWKTVNKLFSMRGKHDFFFMLPDDFRVKPDFVDNALRLWHEIKDPQKICLNLYTDRVGVPCWTQFTPEDCGNVWKTQWVDMCFLATERFFTELGLVPYGRRNYGRYPQMGSGVGCHVSLFLTKKGFNMYMVKESLVKETGEHGHSKMKEIIEPKPKDNYNGRPRSSINPPAEHIPDPRLNKFYRSSR